MGLARPIDVVLALVKWPCALLCLAFTPGAALGLWAVAGDIAAEPDRFRVFGAGFGGYLVIWWLFFRGPVSGSLFSTVEHEMTHALFAVLTGHRVVGLQATWRSGGAMEFAGGPGNWLVHIAPYWFPTVCVPFVVVAALGPTAHLQWLSAAMGIALAYQLTSTWRELHPGQTDLQNVGFLFATLVLPFLNIVAVAVVLVTAGWGLEGVADWFGEVSQWSRETYSVGLSWASEWFAALSLRAS